MLSFLGKLGEYKYISLTNKNKFIACKDNQPIMKSLRCKTIGMYVMNLNDSLQLEPSLKNSLKTNLIASTVQSGSPNIANIHDFIPLEKLQFLHRDLGGPPLRNLKRTVKVEYLMIWLELNIQKSLNKLTTRCHAIFGHLNQKIKKT